MTDSKKTTKNTKQRVLESACKVFAEKGYRDANITEICQLAEANRAAVNYYFRDKEEIYRQVWRYANDIAIEVYPLEKYLSENPTPEERLRAFIFVKLHRIFSKDAAGYIPKLMVREMAEPTEVFEEIFHEIIIPQIDQLTSIIWQLLGEKATEQQVHLAAMSVVSQCVFFSFNQAMHQRHFSDQEHSQKIVEYLTEHITSFSLSGICEICKHIVEADS